MKVELLNAKTDKKIARITACPYKLLYMPTANVMQW